MHGQLLRKLSRRVAALDHETMSSQVGRSEVRLADFRSSLISAAFFEVYGRTRPE
jgi:hypothetical protein